VFRFPGSYLDWARQYGYGRALGLLIMYAPSPMHPDSILIQGERVCAFIRMAMTGGYLDYTPDGSKELAEQLFPFAASENGEYFAWRLQVPTPAEAGRPEYPIYCLGPRMQSIRYGAGDLDNLLRRLTSAEVKDVLGPGYAPLPRTFQPLA